MDNKKTWRIVRQSKLAQIKQRAASLNAATDKLNATVEHIEKELAGSGVDFWWNTQGSMLGLRIHRGDESQRSYYVLGYTRIGDEWRLAVQLTHGELVDAACDQWDDSADGEPTALARAPRRIRIEAANFLEQFLEGLAKEIGKMQGAVDNAIVLLEAIGRRAVESASSIIVEVYS